MILPLSWLVRSVLPTVTLFAVFVSVPLSVAWFMTGWPWWFWVPLGVVLTAGLTYAMRVYMGRP